MTENKVRIPEAQFDGVIQSPDGSIQYYTATTIKNKHNPYLSRNVLSNIESNDSNDYIEIECNGEIIQISISDYNRAITLEWKALLVRVLCLFDFFINVLITFNTQYNPVYSILISTISLSGYYSTYIYSRTGLILYLVYQYFQSIAKIVFLSLYIAAASSDEIKKQLNNNLENIFQPTPENIIIVSFVTLGQIYITGYIHRFYILLPYRGRPPTPRATLREERTICYPIFNF